MIAQIHNIGEIHGTIRGIIPEIALFATTCVVMVLGLSPSLPVRRLCAPVTALGLAIAGVLAVTTTPETLGGTLPWLPQYAKAIIAVVGLLLVPLAVGTVDRTEEHLVAQGKIEFNPLRTNRAEFWAFFLFSLTGLMLCASARDLIWLFLALELTSLPTYIMVTISGQNPLSAPRSNEAGVKYFFLGAMSAAMFLFGFALLYGATGTTSLPDMAAIFAQRGVDPLAMIGMLLAVVGVSYKIAAVPLHFYTPDVYEGAASPVSAFLAFVPKAAGFLSIILLVSTMGWHFLPGESAVDGVIHATEEGFSLPPLLRLTLWVMAALTMTVGNVLAVLQNNVKRILAYSSIAHSGYMLVGVIAGPGESITTNGLGAVLFYLLVYGVSNIGAFAVLASLERRVGPSGEPAEIETVDDLRGLCYTHPVLGWTMVLSALSLLGFPPLLGFLGKLPLFTAAISKGEIPLVIVLGLNSAIAAFYYLRLVAVPLLDSPDPTAAPAARTPFASRVLAGFVSAAGVLVLILVANSIMRASSKAGLYRGPEAAIVETDGEHAAAQPPDAAH